VGNEHVDADQDQSDHKPDQSHFQAVWGGRGVVDGQAVDRVGPGWQQMGVQSNGNRRYGSDDEQTGGPKCREITPRLLQENGGNESARR
jgi:hypothetical protein